MDYVGGNYAVERGPYNWCQSPLFLGPSIDLVWHKVVIFRCVDQIFNPTTVSEDFLEGFASPIAHQLKVGAFSGALA